MLIVRTGGTVGGSLFIHSVALLANVGKTWLAWEEKVDEGRHYPLSKGGAQ